MAAFYARHTRIIKINPFCPHCLGLDTQYSLLTETLLLVLLRLLMLCFTGCGVIGEEGREGRTNDVLASVISNHSLPAIDAHHLYSTHTHQPPFSPTTITGLSSRGSQPIVACGASLLPSTTTVRQASSSSPLAAYHSQLPPQHTILENDDQHHSLLLHLHLHRHHQHHTTTHSSCSRSTPARPTRKPHRTPPHPLPRPLLATRAPPSTQPS